MEYKLLACDMDGTLFGADYVISNENKTAIKNMVKKGYYFVLCTGRPLKAVEKFIRELEIENQPLILNNGVDIYCNGQQIYKCVLKQNLVKQIVELGREKGVEMIAWQNDKFYAEKDGKWVRYYENIPNIKPTFVDDLTILDQVTKIIWFQNDDLTKKYHREFGEIFKNKLNVTPSRKEFLEFFSIESSKANALKIIGEKLNVSQAETVAVGDGFNDLSMINYAGLGVAMANAPDKVKESADFVTLSCEENGVNHLIGRFFK